MSDPQRQPVSGVTIASPSRGGRGSSTSTSVIRPRAAIWLPSSHGLVCRHLRAPLCRYTLRRRRAVHESPALHPRRGDCRPPRWCPRRRRRGRCRTCRTASPISRAIGPTPRTRRSSATASSARRNFSRPKRQWRTRRSASRSRTVSRKTTSTTTTSSGRARNTRRSSRAAGRRSFTTRLTAGFRI